MPVLVDIQVPAQFDPVIDRELLRQAVEATLRRQAYRDDAEVVLVIAGEEDMRSLNRQFRNLDSPTDVLSFPGTLDEGFVTPEGYAGYLGDVVICYPRAEVQAAEAGRSVAQELQLLTIHGVLHLLGFDDADEAGWRRMTEIQNAILVSLESAPSATEGAQGEGTPIGK